MILAAGDQWCISAKPALAGASKPRARTVRYTPPTLSAAAKPERSFEPFASLRCKLIYQRVHKGNKLSSGRAWPAIFLIAMNSSLSAAARPCSCTREHRFRSLTPFAPGTSSNSIPRTSFLRASCCATTQADASAQCPCTSLLLQTRVKWLERLQTRCSLVRVSPAEQRMERQRNERQNG